MEEMEIKEICQANQLLCKKITRVVGSFEKELFFIDDEYLIRTSKQSMLDEQIRIDRIKDLMHVPKIVHASDQRDAKCEIYYLLLQYMKGVELFAVYHDLQAQDIYALAEEIDDFLVSNCVSS